MAAATKLKLHTMLGNYPNTKALKSGAIRSDLVDFDFVEVCSCLTRTTRLRALIHVGDEPGLQPA